MSLLNKGIFKALKCLKTQYNNILLFSHFVKSVIVQWNIPPVYSGHKVISARSRPRRSHDFMK